MLKGVTKEGGRKGRTWDEALHECRDEIDLSYRELAEITGVSHAQVQRWNDPDSEGEPSGLHKAILISICQWNDRYIRSKVDLLRVLRKRGHLRMLKKIVVT